MERRASGFNFDHSLTKSNEVPMKAHPIWQQKSDGLPPYQLHKQAAAAAASSMESSEASAPGKAASRSKQQVRSATRRTNILGTAVGGLRGSGSAFHLMSGSISSKVAEQTAKMNRLGSGANNLGRMNNLGGQGIKFGSMHSLTGLSALSAYQNMASENDQKKEHPYSLLGSSRQHSGSESKQVLQKMAGSSGNPSVFGFQKMLHLHKGKNQFEDDGDHMPRLGGFLSPGDNIGKPSIKGLLQRSSTGISQKQVTVSDSFTLMASQQVKKTVVDSSTVLGKKAMQTTETGGNEVFADISLDAPNSSTGGGFNTKRQQQLQMKAQKAAAQTNQLNTERKPTNQSLSLLNTVKGNFVALKYKTRIVVEGQGEYQIEITNVVNTKTLKERPIIPSLMNMANVQRIEANRCKRIMQSSIPRSQAVQASSGLDSQLALQSPPNRMEEGLRVLQRLFKRNLRRNFDYLQMGSIDYKRSLMLKRQQEEFRKMRAIEQISNRLRVQQVVARTKAFYRWREVTKDFSLTEIIHNSEMDITTHQQLSYQELLEQFKQLQESQRASNRGDETDKLMTSSISKLSKRQKCAIKLMDRNMMARLSDYFSCWKLKVLLQKGQSQISHLDQSLAHGAECSLDYSMWRNQLEQLEKNNLEGKQDFRNTVTVRKVRASQIDGSEETKEGIKTTREQDAGADNTSQDYLMNYTFDLSLDDHMLGRATHPQCYQTSETSENVFEEHNETQEQVDNLLDELNEFVAANRQFARPAALDAPPSYRTLASDQTSPFLPRRYSMIQDGVASSSSPTVEQNAPFERAIASDFKLTEDTDNIQLRRPSNNYP